MKNKAKAQAMLEFALAIPVVLVIMMGIIESGRLLFIYTSLSAAGREAARYGASIGELVSTSTPLYNDCSGIRAAAARIGFFAGVVPDKDHVKISHDQGPGTTSVPYCTSPTDTITITLGDRILVDVTADYNPILRFLPIPDMTLESQSAHTLVKEAPVVAYTPQVVNVGQTCDNTKYKFISITNPMGPDVTITVKNTSVENRTIKNILVVWDPTSGPILNNIYKDLNPTPVLTPMAAAPAYSKDVSWGFNIDQPVVIKLSFSKSLKNNAIVRFNLDNNCAFGQ